MIIMLLSILFNNSGCVLGYTYIIYRRLTQIKLG